MLRKPLITATVLLSSTVLLLSGCTSDTTEKTTTDFTLDTTSKIDSTPNWNEKSVKAFDKTWEINSIKQTETQPSSTLVISEDQKCNASYSTTFLPEYQADRGDKFISQFYAYQLAQNNGQTIKLTSSNIKSTTNDSVEFLTGNIKFDANIALDIPQEPTDEATEPSDNPAGGKVDSRIAVRGFDVKTPNGLDKTLNIPADRLGSDPHTGVPVLVINYQCLNQDTDETVWKNILDKALIDLPVAEVKQ
jgi:hypothetical protein